jgi:cytochrome c-type biogenesis protein CcmF
MIKLLIYKRRKYGGYIIHLSMLVIVFGLIGTQFYMESYSIKLREGETFSIGGYTIKFGGVDINNEVNKVSWIANVLVYKDGKYISTMTPRIERYLKQDMYTSRVDTYLIPELLGDLYVVFESLTEDGVASFKVEIMPLVKLLWYSGYLILIGGFLALIPRKVVEKI